MEDIKKIRNFSTDLFSKFNSNNLVEKNKKYRFN